MTRTGLPLPAAEARSSARSWRPAEPGPAAAAAETPAVLLATIPSRLALLAGAWLLVAPFALGYSTTGNGFRAYWDDVAVGVAVLAVNGLRVTLPGRTAVLGPLAAALGGWLVAAPFVLGYATGGAPRAVVNDVLVGLLLVVLAAVGSVLEVRAREPDRR